MQYHVYNTGDQVWTSQRYGQRVTVKMITHDGIVWEEGDATAFRKLKGVELFIHKVQTFCVKAILKVLNA